MDTHKNTDHHILTLFQQMDRGREEKGKVVLVGITVGIIDDSWVPIEKNIQ